MDFLQRRGHLFIWYAIASLLLVGLLTAIYTSQDKTTQPDGHFIVYDEGQILDSVYVEELHSDFLLRQGRELYIQVKVHEELPVTSLKAYHGDSLAGFIESKGTHIFNYAGHEIENLTLKDPITGRVFLIE